MRTSKRICSSVWAEASWKRFDRLGLDAPIPAEWLAFEKESMEVYAKASADALALRAFFRAFTASWDWWRARAAELESPQPSFPEVMIRP